MKKRVKAEPDRGPRGYGNIYTPHAGAMIIHIQRESGLANRTIILSTRQFRLLRLAAIVAAVVLVVGTVTWVYFAKQTVRARVLGERVVALQRDVQQLDTLKRALAELDARFQQVQKMMGSSGGGAATPAGAAAAAMTAADSTNLPNEWPLPIAGALLDPSTSPAGSVGIEIAVPRGTPVRAAGGGLVVEIRR